jgi:hypothetical protein
MGAGSVGAGRRGMRAPVQRAHASGAAADHRVEKRRAQLAALAKSIRRGARLHRSQVGVAARHGRAHGPRRLSLRAYPGWVVARVARCAFLNAMRPLASCRRARWFSSFLDQRIRMPRLRFSQEWVASTTQRRARQPGVRALSLISSPRERMCGV